MESNLIALPTVIVALPTLPTLITLVAGGVGLGKPGRNLRGGAGSHQQGQQDQRRVNCRGGERKSQRITPATATTFLPEIMLYLDIYFTFIFFIFTSQHGWVFL